MKTDIAPPRPSTTRPVPLAELAAAAAFTGGRLQDGDPTVAVTGVTLRAHQVRPGDLFAALPGSRAHGADFAAEALEAGAVAVLTDPAGAGRMALMHPAGTGRLALTGAPVPLLVHEAPRRVLGRLSSMVYGNPSSRLAVIGITGTAGKTTTSYLVQAGLTRAGHTTGLIGTVQTMIAGECLDSAFTTPEAPDLQGLLALMLERGVSHVAMEVSSHALALGRADGTAFAVGAFTNLSQDHLDFHADMEDYFAAKALLFDGRCAREVVNVDDPYGRRLVKSETVTVSAAGDPQASWRVADVVAEPGGQRFRVLGPGGLDLPAAIRLPGGFNAANAVLAVATLAAVGTDPADAVKGIAETVVPGRMEPVDAGQPYPALVDYAHTPEAVQRLLAAVRAGTPGRVIVVLGCGGDRDRAKRPLMGAAAARGSDLLVVTDDNPRSEQPAAIRSAMLAGALAVPPGERGEVVEVGDRREAVAAAVRAARPGDALVVAGKGHEQGQEIAGAVHPFDDRTVLRAAIGGASG